MNTITTRPRWWVAVAAAAALTLSACGGGDDDEDREVLATVEDTEFGSIDVYEPEGDELRVVAVGWSDAEMALALGVTPVGVIDWQGFGEENKGVGPWATELFGDEEPTLIDLVDFAPNFEQVDLLDPDVILSARSAVDEDVYEQLSDIAPTVYAPEGTPPYATAWDVQMRQVGAALGLADEAEALVADTEQAIADTAAEYPELDGLTVVAGSKYGDAYAAYLPGDGRLDLLLDLGMVNSTDVEGLVDEGFSADIPGEQVELLEADVTVILGLGYTLADMESDDLLQSLDVVSEDRAVLLEEQSEIGLAWSTASVLSIPVVLDELVPQLAAAADNL